MQGTTRNNSGRQVLPRPHETRNPRPQHAVNPKGREGKENMVCMERRLGGKEGGMRRSRQREAAAAAGRAEVARSACTNRTMELPPQKGRDPLFARDGARRDALGLTHSSPASRARTPAAMQRQAAGQGGSSTGEGWAGRWVGGREGETEPKEGGGVWDKACWAVRSSPQHRQRRPQRQSVAASKRQRPARPSGSKRQRAVVAQASATARQRRRRRR